MAIGSKQALPTEFKGAVPKAMWACVSLASKGTIYICHRHGIGDKEKTMDSCVAIVIVSFGSDAGKCIDKLDISSAHVQWFSH